MHVHNALTQIAFYLLIHLPFKILSKCLSGFYLTECATGFFGNNCAENCSVNCGDPGICDKVTGHCNGTCLAGWEGDLCQNGKYIFL